MKKIMILATFILLLGVMGAYAQALPDLVVVKIECSAPQSKLLFSVANRSNVPLPKGWRAVAEVYFEGTKMGAVDLGRPTSGSIEPAGGSATYLVAFDITKPVTVKVIVDSTNDIKESNETNNSGGVSLKPCGGLPDLKVIHTDHQPAGNVPQGKVIQFKVTVQNFGTGLAPGTVKADGSTTFDGYMIDISLSKEAIRDPVRPRIVPSPYSFVEGMLLKGGRIDRTVDLAPGASKEYVVSVEIPKDTPPGKYWIGVSLSLIHI